MKRYIFAAMFLLGLTSAVFSQNNTEEKVLAEYKLSFYPDTTYNGDMLLRYAPTKVAKLERFIESNFYSWELNPYGTHVVTIQKVKDNKSKKTFLRLSAMASDFYPKKIDSSSYQVLCYSRLGIDSLGKSKMELQWIAGSLRTNPVIKELLDKTIEPKILGMCWVITICRKGYNEKFKAPNYVLESVTYQKYPMEAKF